MVVQVFVPGNGALDLQARTDRWHSKYCRVRLGKPLRRGLDYSLVYSWDEMTSGPCMRAYIKNVPQCADLILKFDLDHRQKCLH